VRIIVCGSRWFESCSYVYLSSTLRGIGPTEIIAGGASGIDSLAITYSRAKRIHHRVYYPDWFHDQKAAGPIRNRLMLHEGYPVDAVVAFWGGRGTADMVRQARDNGVAVVEIPPDPATEWWRTQFEKGEGNDTS
jgi:hypothetical protein